MSEYAVSGRFQARDDWQECETDAEAPDTDAARGMDQLQQQQALGQETGAVGTLEVEKDTLGRRTGELQQKAQQQVRSR
jgi:hypothetical protein